MDVTVHRKKCYLILKCKRKKTFESKSQRKFYVFRYCLHFLRNARLFFLPISKKINLKIKII